MDFLDGFLIRKQQDTVQDIFERKLDKEITSLSGVSKKEIIDLVNESKKKFELPMFNKIFGAKTSVLEGKKFGAKEEFDWTSARENTIGDETSDINAIIEGALREVQRELLKIEPKDKSERIFFHLIKELKGEPKVERSVSRMKGNKPNVIIRVLGTLERGQEVSEDLRNQMHDEGLISLGFLIQLDDIKNNRETIQPSIARRFQAKPKLLDKLIELIETLSGFSSPKRTSLEAELKRLRTGRARGHSSVSQILSDSYKYTSNSKRDISKLRRKLRRKLSDWDNVISSFYSATDGLDEGGERIIEEVWGSDVFVQNHINEWRSLAETGSVDYEELSRESIKKEFEKLLKAKLAIEELIRAGEKIVALGNEKNPDVIYPFIDEGIRRSIDNVQETYDSITQNSSNFDNFREEILQEMREDLKKMYTDEILKANSPMLDKAPTKKKKKVKKVLQTAQPSEYMGQDFTKLGDLLTELQDLDVNKSDKKMMKKLASLEEKNLNLVSRASELRKDYELMYRQLRGMVYPKSQGDLGDEKDE